MPQRDISKGLKMNKGYVGYSIDDYVRNSSTSGGICQIISQAFVDKRGIVSGVYFDDNFDLRRGFASSHNGLLKFNKSKYIQSMQKDSYREIKNYIENGNELLYIGTPCEVAGLQSFLGKKYPNLYCIDFVCLGVPSKKAWNMYRKEYFGDKKLVNIDYKDKQNGWRNFTFLAKFDDGSSLSEEGRKNHYMYAMIKKYNSRPSCYKCQFRTMKRISDITVADAWGTERIAKELIDDKGTSSIMVNSEKGEKLIDMIRDKCRLKEVTVENLWIGNLSAFKQYPMPKERKYFYLYLDKYGFKKTIWLLKLKQFINRISDKILKR